MRQVSLAVATLAALALAGAAYADSNYGPRHNGNQCWHNQGSLPAFAERPGCPHQGSGQRQQRHPEPGGRSGVSDRVCCCSVRQAPHQVSAGPFIFAGPPWPGSPLPQCRVRVTGLCLRMRGKFSSRKLKGFRTDYIRSAFITDIEH